MKLIERLRQIRIASLSRRLNREVNRRISDLEENRKRLELEIEELTARAISAENRASLIERDRKFLLEIIERERERIAFETRNFSGGLEKINSLLGQ